MIGCKMHIGRSLGFARASFGHFRNFWHFKQTKRTKSICQSPFARKYGTSVTACNVKVAQVADPIRHKNVIERAKQNFEGAWPEGNAIMRYTGNGVHLGIKGQWSLLVRPDGAFVEEFTSPTIRISSGFDGTPGKNSWEMDSSGTYRELELDDHEVALLTNWVKTGAWLRSEIENQIDVWCETSHEVSRPSTSSCEPQDTASTSGRNEEEDTQKVFIQLKKKKVKASVWLNSESLLTEKMEVLIAGKPETYTFRDWTIYDRHWAPNECIHSTSGLQKEAAILTNFEVVKSWSQNEFCMPPIQYLPSDTEYDVDMGGKIQAWWSSSGHIVVQPILNGSQKVYMILDTGASGFVIEKESADKLGMSVFGSFHCHGMVQHFPSKLRQCETIKLGPMTMKDPIFMEMSLTNIVKGGPGRISGIIGYDVFRRTVMQIPEIKGGGMPFEIQLHNPAKYESPTEYAKFWHELEFISNLPIINCTMGLDTDSHKIQLMIDSGAGGIDLMINKRATDSLGILNKIKTSTSFLKGVGGDSDERQQVKSGKIPWLSISETKFRQLNCLFIGDVGLDLSHYVQGIMCGELLARGQTILDFARKRIAFLPNNMDTHVTASKE